MPVDYKLYHPEWFTRIRPAILALAQHKCENCDLPDRLEGQRDKQGNFHPVDEILKMTGSEKAKAFGKKFETKEIKFMKIVLTIAHLDHDINNNDYSNLMALCQRCHLNYDRADNLKRRKQKFLGIGTGDLFEKTH